MLIYCGVVQHVFTQGSKTVCCVHCGLYVLGDNHVDMFHHYCRPPFIPYSWIRILTAVMMGGAMLQHPCQKRRLQPTLQPATREPYRNSNSPSRSPTRVYVVCVHVHVCVTTSNAKFSASSFKHALKEYNN